ncbi:MAG TPA: ferredoxin [Geobacteraceae bacterium]
MVRGVVVDQDVCIGCGLCVSLAPQVFRLVDGVSRVHDPAGAVEAKIQECIDGCPVSAISWQG